VGLFVTLGMHHDIDASILDLSAAGVDLAGMYVVHRNLTLGERRLVGRIASVLGQNVHLSEATGAQVVPIDSVKLEGSIENFSRCLNALLRHRYKSLMDALDDEEAAYRLGPDFDDVIATMGNFLRKSTITLAQDVYARVGDRIILDNDDETRTVYLASNVDYVFDRTGAKSADFAWVGLSRYGPYDRATFANKSPRLLVAFPASTQGKVEAF
jgi:hypothetical protein